MTERAVVIHVHSQHTYPGAEPDATELMTEGTMSLAEDGAVALRYRETELTGMEGTVTRLTVRGDTVELERTGAVVSTMVFQKGRPHSSLYETPWGATVVDIYATSVAHRFTEQGGVLGFDYTVSIDHQLVGETRVEIRVRERKVRATI